MRSIGENAFFQSGIESVSIPGTVKKIETRAFYWCGALRSVELNSGLVEIGEDAFNDCYHMQNVTFPETLERIGAKAFISCSEFGNIELPASVKYIGEYAFSTSYYSKSAKVISHNPVPPACSDNSFECLWSNGLNTYYDGELIVPAGSVDAYKAAVGWRKFKNICSEEFVVDGLKYRVTSESAKTCQLSGYEKCNSNLDIPSQVSHDGTTYTVTRIANSALSYANLTSVTIPESVTGIDAYALAGNHFSTLSIPASVTYIGRDAFRSDNLLTVYSYGTVPPAGNEAAFSETTLRNGTLYIPSLGLKDYLHSEIFRYFNNIVLLSPDPVIVFNHDNIWYSVVMDGDRTVCIVGNSIGNETEITIPETVEYDNTTFTVCGLAKEAFKDCKDITSVSLPSTIIYVDSKAFSGCTGLTDITFREEESSPEAQSRAMRAAGGSALETIGSEAFENCSGLTKIVIPASVNSVGASAFAGCSGLTAVTSLNPEPPECGENAFDEDVYATAGLTVPSGSRDSYKAADEWKRFLSVTELTPTGIEEIEYETEISGEIFNLNGVRIGSATENLLPGMYIIRSGKTVRKVIIR